MLEIISKFYRRGVEAMQEFLLLISVFFEATLMFNGFHVVIFQDENS